MQNFLAGAEALAPTLVVTATLVLTLTRALTPLLALAQRERQILKIALDDDATGKLRAAAALGAAGNVKYLFDVVSAQFPAVSAHAFIKTADEAFGKHAQRLGIIALVRARILPSRAVELKGVQQGVYGDRERVASLRWADERLETIFDERLPESFFLAGKTCELVEMFHDGWRKIAREQRQELFTDSGARAAGVAVGGILAPGLADGAQIFPELLAASCQQRPHHCANDGVNAAEAGEARAANDVRENCFGLIVGGVGHGDVRCATFGDDTVEKRVAQLARRVFEIAALPTGFSADIFASEDELESVRLREFRDEFGVRIGFRRTQRMIEVDDGERDSEIVAQARQQAQKRH